MSKEADEVKGVYFPVLDHGFVALVDYMGDDAAVVQAARISYGAGTKKISEDRGVMRYLMRHKHTTPYEMVELKFHVKLPIFVARQLIRHRTASVNEYSLRYSLPFMQFYTPEPEVMGSQSKKNKQGRAAPIDDVSARDLISRWQGLQEQSVALYEAMIRPDVDLARELARLHLPLSTYTEWYWKIDLHNLLGFLRLRCDHHAQWEIQEVARLKAAIAKRVAPVAFEAWIDYVFQSRTFSRMEMQLLRRMVHKDRDFGADEHCLSSGVGGFSADVTWERAHELGLSRREWEEFLTTFDVLNNPDLYEPESFHVDPANGFPPEHFAEEAKKYLPKTV